MINFFIVGAQRSATSWLYSALDQSSEVCMLKPLFPEVKYFLQPTSELNSEKYLSLFNPSESEFILGEKATSYIDSPETALKIKTMFPAAKIIICLRNPVERALSNYFFSYNYGVETRSLEEVFIEEAAPPPIELKAFSANPFAYLERGLYSRYLDYYTEIFGPEQILITFMENFTSVGSEVSKVLNFLGGSHSPPEGPSAPVNKSCRDSKISKDIISKLQEYYHKDTRNLIQTYGLNIPYAYT